jgi:hypothetical protein
VLIVDDLLFLLAVCDLWECLRDNDDKEEEEEEAALLTFFSLFLENCRCILYLVV